MLQRVDRFTATALTSNIAQARRLLADPMVTNTVEYPEMMCSCGGDDDGNAFAALNVRPTHRLTQPVRFNPQAGTLQRGDDADAPLHWLPRLDQAENDDGGGDDT